jgi:hypothetical protein
VVELLFAQHMYVKGAQYSKIYQSIQN